MTTFLLPLLLVVLWLVQLWALLRFRPVVLAMLMLMPCCSLPQPVPWALATRGSSVTSARSLSLP